LFAFLGVASFAAGASKRGYTLLRTASSLALSWVGRKTAPWFALFLLERIAFWSCRKRIEGIDGHD
jgi:hypothetical protein